MSNDPITQRQDLEARITSAWTVYNDSAAARQRADTALGEAKRELDQLRKQLPTGGATEKQLKAAEMTVHQASVEFAVHSEREQGALSATHALENDLAQLLAAHPEEFAAQAEQATQQALDALERLAGAYDAARASWDAAVASWTPLCRALRMQGVDPWPPPEQLLTELRAGSLIPRPRAVNVTA